MAASRLASSGSRKNSIAVRRARSTSPGVHPVVADIEETDVDGSPGESGPDSGRIGTVSQVSDVDHRNLGRVDRVGPSSGKS